VRVNSETTGGMTVIGADWLTVPHAAVILGVDLVDAGFVAITNVALVDPAGTVTKLGTVATDGVSDVKFTLAPPVGAAVFNATVP